MSTDGQATLDEFAGPPNDPDKPQCQATADHTGERCERVAAKGLPVCSLHIDQLADVVDEESDFATTDADAGSSIPRHPED